MSHLRRLWPKTLAARLVLLLVAALAVAQLALVAVLQGRQGAIAAEMAHSQALNQTVTLARLLTIRPDEEALLLSAFGSRVTCAVVAADAPPAHLMASAEARLAGQVGAMLHGLGTGAPQIDIARLGGEEHPCGPPQAGGVPWQRAGGSADAFDGDDFAAAVSITVPLADGRWLTTHSQVDTPGGWDQAALLSFLLSSVAVALVAVFAVRSQTRSLRALAEASDRFGRGETVAPLSPAGPSESAAAIVAFNTMQERQGQFLRDRLRLLAGVSHDLRTPLTTLRLKAEFVEDEAVRDGIVATIEELTAICDATLAFSHAEATAEATEEVDLAALVAEVAEHFHLAGAGVVVTQAPPLRYPCRPVAMRRALRNLVENAVRYAGGARIALVADTAAVTVAVEDDGPGLPPAQIEEAFKPFVRLEPSRNAETGGLGLGLSIARSIVKAHGGTLTLANRPEGGLCAEIRLPPR